MTMTQAEALQLALDAGIIFPEVKGIISEENKAAMDAELQTTPNSGVPALFTAYIDPMTIEILTAPQNATKIFGETRKGDWTTPFAVFKTMELVGQSTPYTDFGNGAAADVNVNFPTRENYVAQTHIRYGEMEMANYGKATINLAAEKQRAVARLISKETNKFYLKGVEGKEIYGLLNEPNIPAAITPTTGASGTTWENKTTAEIYADVLALAKELFTNSQGLIDETSELVLVVSPAVNVNLGKATDYNVSVKDMLNKYFSNISIVVLPELASDEAGNTVMLVAKTVDGSPVAQFGFSDKMRAFALLPKSSSYEQKFAFGTYGCILFRPFAIAVMTGC